MANPMISIKCYYLKILLFSFTLIVTSTKIEDGLVAKRSKNDNRCPNLAKNTTNLTTSTLITTTTSPLIVDDDTLDICQDLYYYLYPLITMDITRKQMINQKIYPNDILGMNVFHHARKFPYAGVKVVVRPNLDTLYSTAWLNISSEPVIISVPDTNGRFYLLPIMDMWSDVISTIGKRTTGTLAGDFAVVYKGWNGILPENITRIDAPTPYLWILGRTQTNGEEDYNNVYAIQNGYKITPLSYWISKTAYTPNYTFDSTIDAVTSPLEQVNSMTPETYFSYGAELMKLHHFHDVDWNLIISLKKIGFNVGESFDFNIASQSIKNALIAAISNGLETMKTQVSKSSSIVNGWTYDSENMGVYGINYLKRAITTYYIFGANQPKDSIYLFSVSDTNCDELDSKNNYRIHFDLNSLTPANAFWSITLYDSNGFLVETTPSRYIIRDRDNLTYNADGSLDIYVQNTSPGPEKESNWLPSPANEKLELTMRIYAPKYTVFNGMWSPPPIIKF